MSLLDSLKAKRTEIRAAADLLITRAAEDGRDLTADESAEHLQRAAELRELDDRIEDLLADQVRELRAATVRTDGPIANRGGVALAAELRALTGAGATGGGAFTPSEFPSYFFDQLAAESVGLRSGFRVIRTTRDSLVVPRWTLDTSAGWTAEGDAIVSVDADADQITATPRKLAALQAMSNESIADSNPALLDVAAAGLVRSVALKLDLGFFEGSGIAPEIGGLKTVTGIGEVSMGADGAVPTNLDPIADAIGKLEAANARATAIVMHPRSWLTLSKLKEAAGSTKPLLQDSAGSGSQGISRSLYGVPVFLSSQMSITETQGLKADCSSIYVYQADEVCAVIREDVRVERDSSRLFNSDQTEVRAIMRADVVVPNPAAVVRIVGVRA